MDILRGPSGVNAAPRVEWVTEIDTDHAQENFVLEILKIKALVTIILVQVVYCFSFVLSAILNACYKLIR